MQSSKHPVWINSFDTRSHSSGTGRILPTYQVRKLKHREVTDSSKVTWPIRGRVRFQTLAVCLQCLSLYISVSWPPLGTRKKCTFSSPTHGIRNRFMGSPCLGFVWGSGEKRGHLYCIVREGLTKGQQILGEAWLMRQSRPCRDPGDLQVQSPGQRECSQVKRGGRRSQPPLLRTELVFVWPVGLLFAGKVLETSSVMRHPTILAKGI